MPQRSATTHQLKPGVSRRPALRCKTVCCAKPKQDDVKAPIPTKTQSSYFPQVVSNLLWNAASTRNRGKASCNVCKTEGAVLSQINDCSLSSYEQHSSDTNSFETREEDKFRMQQGVSSAGSVVCPECGGTRVVLKETNAAKAHAQAKVAAFMSGKEQKFTKGDWMVSNRCKACHGTGCITCPACGGEGFRHD
jgi:hypothetical protein